MPFKGEQTFTHKRKSKEIYIGEKVMKCFYHKPDLDGHCSGAIVKREYPSCEMIPLDYDDEFPWDTIEKNELVIMVDFGLQPFSDMIKLNNLADLIWIDHHATALDNHEKSGEPIDGIRRLDSAGCELTWEYFNPSEQIPRSVYYLGRYDIWKHEEDPYILLFQYGMQQFKDTSPESDVWTSLLPNSNSFKNYVNGNIDKELVSKITEDGKIIQKYQEAINDKSVKALAFDVTFEGLRGIAANIGRSSSLYFESLWDEDKYDIMIPFCRKNGTWTVSLYTTKENINVGEIAKKYGGGGHKGAAGFQIQKLPFKA